jgi:hypothetical protein
MAEKTFAKTWKTVSRMDYRGKLIYSVSLHALGWGRR